MLARLPVVYQPVERQTVCAALAVLAYWPQHNASRNLRQGSQSESLVTSSQINRPWKSSLSCNAWISSLVASASRANRSRRDRPGHGLHGRELERIPQLPSEDRSTSRNLGGSSPGNRTTTLEPSRRACSIFSTYLTAPGNDQNVISQLGPSTRLTIGLRIILSPAGRNKPSCLAQRTRRRRTVSENFAVPSSLAILSRSHISSSIE